MKTVFLGKFKRATVRVQCSTKRAAESRSTALLIGEIISFNKESWIVEGIGNVRQRKMKLNGVSWIVWEFPVKIELWYSVFN